jgi:putative NIF3 family GTP cyclohydrolase 1 type 2
MQPTFAKALGLADEIRRDTAVGVYRIEPVPFSALAARVKAALGLEHIRVAGPAERTVRTLAVGFGFMGAVTDAIIANGAEAGVFGEVREHSFIAAREAGVGIIEATHVVSEGIGFRSVVAALTDRVPGVPVKFLEVPFPFRWE